MNQNCPYMATRQQITSVGETPTFWNTTKPAVSGTYEKLLSCGLTLSLTPTCFDCWFTGDPEWKCHSYFSFLFPFLFFPPYLGIYLFIFYFIQLRGSFLSLYYSSCYVSSFPWSMCHMDTCSWWNSPYHMILMPSVLLPWCHVVAPGHTMCHHPMCHQTLDVLKDVKF